MEENSEMLVDHPRQLTPKGWVRQVLNANRNPLFDAQGVGQVSGAALDGGAEAPRVSRMSWRVSGGRESERSTTQKGNSLGGEALVVDATNFHDLLDHAQVSRVWRSWLEWRWRCCLELKGFPSLKGVHAE